MLLGGRRWQYIIDSSTVKNCKPGPQQSSSPWECCCFPFRQSSIMAASALFYQLKVLISSYHSAKEVIAETTHSYGPSCGESRCGQPKSWKGSSHMEGCLSWKLQLHMVMNTSLFKCGQFRYFKLQVTKPTLPFTVASTLGIFAGLGRILTARSPNLPRTAVFIFRFQLFAIFGANISIFYSINQGFQRRTFDAGCKSFLLFLH